MDKGWSDHTVVLWSGWVCTSSHTVALRFIFILKVLLAMLFGQQRRKRQSRGTREKIRALFRDPLDPVVKGCLLHFSTVPSYLLLKRPAESFMHRKLKNTAEQSVDEGTQQERSEEARSAAETCNEKWTKVLRRNGEETKVWQRLCLSDLLKMEFHKREKGKRQKEMKQGAF